MFMENRAQKPSIWKLNRKIINPFLANVACMWVKVFKNGPLKICRRQPNLFRQTVSLQNFKRLSSANFTLSILEYLDL